jgi:hypothetical protein
LREVFADQPDFQITEDSEQIIRILEKGVPTDFLDVTISHISFGESGANGQQAVFNPSLAVAYILRSPEVIAFKEAHHILGPSGGGVPGNGVGQWPPEHPRISGSLNNVTVREALDRVLKVFHGMWVYEECSRSESKDRRVFLEFFYLQRAGTNSWIVE